MSTWTPSAVHVLEGFLHRVRSQRSIHGTDPDEIVADFRRHVEEEVASMRLPVVTEHDVRRIVGRLDPVPTPDDDPAPAPEPAKKPQPARSRWSGIQPGAVIIFGIVLPLITFAFEWFTGLCAAALFDPMPHAVHALWVLLVPAAHLAAFLALRRTEQPLPSLVWWANGAAVGIALVYTVLFLPMSPFAALGLIYFGAGLLPLSPVLALAVACYLRGALRRKLEAQRLPLKGWAWACHLAWILTALSFVPEPLTCHWIAQAGSESPATAQAAVRNLRRFGLEETLLRECYGRANRLWLDFFNQRQPNPDLAQQVYFRVTGRSFNTVPPPLSRHQAAGRAVLQDFEWDEGLGGERVAGMVRGLSLMASRIDGKCQPDQGWAYLEWILEFKNDHPNQQREARAQIQLPPGGVVSRLTLWVNGEEREAAFAGRSEVRQAYQKVAVQQRRDPVLVTTTGPDRVLVQCFPIPPRGGSMKIRLGITAPIVAETERNSVLRLPCVLERNFRLGRDLQHAFWLESNRAPVTGPEPSLIQVEPHPDAATFTLRGQITDATLLQPRATLRFPLPDDVPPIRTLDRKGSTPQWLEHRLSSMPPTPPVRIAVVVDGSVEMNEALPEVARAFAGVPASSELALWTAGESVEQLYRSDARGPEPVSTRLAQFRGIGGQDNAPALLQAWEWAAAKPGSVILWVHAPQPVLLSPLHPLEQRLQWRGGSGPTIIDVATKPGPNRIAEPLAAFPAFTALPRFGELANDLDRLFATWTGRIPTRTWTRTTMAPEAAPTTETASASSHLVRLWAWEQIQALCRSGQKAQALTWAARYQLVTPVSGAVVLETAQQFAEAGLTPADPGSVPMVPEPATWVLVILGLALAPWLRARAVRHSVHR